MPHKRNMILISRVKEYNLAAGTLCAEVDIHAGTMFLDRAINQVPVWVGVEYMAQSIAALSGIYGQENNQNTPHIGFVLGCRNYQCFTNGFDVNKTYIVKVEQLFSDMELGSFHCDILCHDKLIATTDLNVFQPESLEKFL